VFPDKFPSMPGQLVVVSRQQVPYIYDLSDDEYHGLMATTKKVAQALDKALSTLRTCSIVEGFEVPHVHVRLYPCTESKIILEPRAEADDTELKALADRVRAAL
jgi:histidine triad (HIT) family protein